jgi:hypothetical protein
MWNILPYARLLGLTPAKYQAVTPGDWVLLPAGGSSSGAAGSSRIVRIGESSNGRKASEPMAPAIQSAPREPTT